MNDIYEIDDDHIEHMENLLIYMNLDDYHDMIDEYKDRYNQYHLVERTSNYKYKTNHLL